jgi:hypothetical protein
MIISQINTISTLWVLSDFPKTPTSFFPLLEREVKGFGILKYLLPFLLIILFYSPPTFALDITLQWDANGEANLAGYKIYYDTDTGAPYNGTGSLEGDSPIDMPLGQDENSDPNIVEYTLTNLPDGEYYFAVTAYNDEVPPVESGYSNQVNYTLPEEIPPEIKETIPNHNSGITDEKRIPTDTSFSVRIEDSDGIDITDTTSINFTIDDGTNPAYERDLGDTSVVRVVKLTSDADTQVTKFWVVYDRALDAYGNFDYDGGVNIKVDAKDRLGYIMQQASYDFNIETLTEHDIAEANRPDTTVSIDVSTTTITVINNDELDGFQVVYDNNEPITPHVEPLEEIPPLNIPGITPVDQPVKLGPPTVFSYPVKLIMPITGADDVKALSIYLFDGTEWVHAVSSYNNGGVIQPGGEGWVVPGSLTYDDTSNPPVLEIQVYHFSGIQAGFVSGASVAVVGLDDAGGGGGCFIDTISDGAPLLVSGKNLGYMWFLTLLSLIMLVLYAWRRAQSA